MSETTASPAEHKRANLDFLPGQPIDHTDVVRTKFRQGPFNYQFLKPYGKKRSRVMYCQDMGELEFVMAQVARGNKVFIEVGPRRI